MSDLIPYLMFPGNCEEALSFYASCLNGEVKDISRFKDAPQEGLPPNFGEKIMHGGVHFGNSVMFASDCPPDRLPTQGNNVYLSIEMKDADEMNKAFEKLSAGGKVTMPLQDQFWGARFGMLVDKYGFSWMFNHTLKK